MPRLCNTAPTSARKCSISCDCIPNYLLLAYYSITTKRPSQEPGHVGPAKRFALRSKRCIYEPGWFSGQKSRASRASPAFPARNRAILRVLWDTGIRVGVLCDLRQSNFDRRQGTLIIFGKGRKERRVALGRNALRTLLYYLDRWRQDAEELEEIGNTNEEHVFLSEGGQALTIHGIEMLFKRLRQRTGLTGK